MAWNTWRHVEAWYGITGASAVYHTLNPRLFPDQIAWILNHAESRMMLADLTFVPLLERLAPSLPHVTRYVILTGRRRTCRGPRCPGGRLRILAGEADGDFAWTRSRRMRRRALLHLRHDGGAEGRALSHRSNVLHALASAGADMFGLAPPTG
jgi:fatty-acyl-CoA synthase